MNNLPDWLWRYIAQKGIDRGFSWFWKKYGKAWCHIANHKLLELGVWHQITLAEILDNVTLTYQQAELALATDHSAKLEEVGEPIEIPYISAFPKIGIASGIGPTFKDSLTPIIKSHKWGIELQPMGALDNKFKSLWSEIKFMPKIDSGWKGAGIASGWKATITSVANLHSGLTGIAKPFAELNSGTGSIAKSKFPLINGTKRFRSGVDFGTDSLAYPLTGAKAIPFINSIVQVDPNPKISILPKDNAFTLAYGTRPKLLYGTVHR